MSTVKVKWLGHACFEIEYDEYKLVLDPFDDVDGYEPVKTRAHEVFCSHQHHDHNYVDGVKLLRKRKSPFEVTLIPSYHDDACGNKRGSNNITVIKVDGLKLVHFGDLGCELDADTLEAVSHADCIMIPTGGTYTLDSKQASALCDKIEPKVIIPMHYKTADYGYEVLESIMDFTALRTNVVFVNNNTISITGDEDPFTAVLNYKK